MARELAMDIDGNLSWCSVPVDQRGTKGCTHIGHKEPGESTSSFMKKAERASQEIVNNQLIETSIEASRVANSEPDIKILPFIDDEPILQSDEVDIEDNEIRTPKRGRDDSEEEWKAKLDFTNDIKAYGVERAKSNLGADHVETIKVELSEAYGVQDPEIQNRVITIMAMTIDDVKSPIKLTGNRHLSYYYAETGEESIMVPGAPKKLTEDLRSYMENSSKDNHLAGIPSVLDIIEG